MDKETLEKTEEQIKRSFSAYYEETEKQKKSMQKSINVLQRQVDFLKFSSKNRRTKSKNNR